MPIDTSTPAFLKTDWPRTRQRFIDWWDQQGLVLWCPAPADQARDTLPPPAPQDLQERWFGAEWRVCQAEYAFSRTYWGGDSFPLLSTASAAGDLAAYLDCPLRLSPETVWFDPCISDPPEAHPGIRFNRDSAYLRAHAAMTDLAVATSRGRFLVSLPDLVENLDILSALRGPQTVMVDLIDRPDWVKNRIDSINQAFFEAFSFFYERVRDESGGNGFIFEIWGPGKTAKVQCDAAAMLSPAMFQEFVVPALSEQCHWLDFAMFHLDGEDCLVHLNALVEIQALKAIEWTPRRLSIGESGGSPQFYDLYRNILAAGKSVQAVGVRYEEVIPLLDAVGGQGMYIQTGAPTEEKARALEAKVEAYR